MTCVFIGGLEVGTKDEEIETFLKGYGEVYDIQIRSKGVGAKESFAFVTFEDERDANAAMEELHEKRFNDSDRRVTLQKATPKGENKDKGYTIWMGGLPEDVREDDISSFCRGYGEVVNVNIKIGTKDTFAFVTLSDERLAKKCMEELDQTVWFGDEARRIKIAPSQKEIKTSWHNPQDHAKHHRSRSPDSAAPWKKPRRDEGADYSSKNHCVFWLKGNCKFGMTCRNFHAEEYEGARGKDVYRSKDAAGSRDTKSGPYRLELRDLPDDMNWSELKDIARGFGASVCYTNLRQEEGIQVGIIEFREKSDAQNALKKFDGKRISGHKRRIKAIKKYE